MLGGAVSNKTLVAMKRADGSQVSEVHCEGQIIRPDAAGVVLIPADHVMAMVLAGYVHTTPST